LGRKRGIGKKKGGKEGKGIGDGEGKGEGEGGGRVILGFCLRKGEGWIFGVHKYTKYSQKYPHLCIDIQL
jgi:hypothetical protein